MASRERSTALLTSDLTGIDDVGAYSRSAHFLSFVAETHGRDSLLELDEALGRDSSSQEPDWPSSTQSPMSGSKLTLVLAWRAMTRTR